MLWYWKDANVRLLQWISATAQRKYWRRKYITYLSTTSLHANFANFFDAIKARPILMTWARACAQWSCGRSSQVPDVRCLEDAGDLVLQSSIQIVSAHHDQVESEETIHTAGSNSSSPPTDLNAQQAVDSRRHTKPKECRAISSTGRASSPIHTNMPMRPPS